MDLSQGNDRTFMAFDAGRLTQTPLLKRGSAFFRQWMLFARQFARHPGMVGSVIPSSPALVDAMLEQVDWASTRLFVEYGPGMGTFTRTVLERMRPDATLLAIDLNPDFVGWLKRELRDPRLHVVEGSAVDVRRFMAQCGHQSADYILSGLPFSTLPKGVGEEIVSETAAALRPGGEFLVYQYSAFVRPLLEPRFAHVQDRRVWLNFPPARIFRATRAAALARAA